MCNIDKICALGTDVNATDARGVTPLHLALSRLKMMGERERREGVEEGGGRGMVAGAGIPLFRKKEITQVSWHEAQTKHLLSHFFPTSLPAPSVVTAIFLSSFSLPPFLPRLWI